MKDGHQVTGEVLAEKPNALFVDLGFDVVRIPRDQVVGRRKRGAEAVAGAATAPSDADPKGFYKTAGARSGP